MVANVQAAFAESLNPIFTLIRWARFVGHLAKTLFLISPPLVVGISVFAGGMLRWSSDGDPGLHLSLIEQIARTRELPTALPFFAARVGQEGDIEAMFPYGYTPFYHTAGAAMYATAGVAGVLLMNALAAAVIAFVVSLFTRAYVPWPATAGAVACLFVSPHVQTVFTNVYMEPLQIGFLFGGAWAAYIALSSRRVGWALAAGSLLGLSIASRQSALLNVAVLGGVVLYAVAQRARSTGGAWRAEVGWVVPLLLAGTIVAFPAIAYLTWVTGTVGYGDLAIPVSGAGPAIDDSANGYITSITRPPDNALFWLSRYQHILFFGRQWLPDWTSFLITAFAVIGGTHLYARGGAARFFAVWAFLQVSVDLLVFMTLHGNERYILVSQMLFYALVPVGWFITFTGLGVPGSALNMARATTVACLAAFSLLFVVPPQYWTQHFFQSEAVDLRRARGDAYNEMGAWVNENTRVDAVILVPRVYSAEFSWQRNMAWVNFYGNAWVVDAIGARDPAAAHEILTRYGVDYVLISDPPGVYVDRMPPNGLRAYLALGQPATKYFTLVHMTERETPLRHRGREITNMLRLYRVNPLR